MTKKILVVEDHRDNMDLVREILEDAGYEVFGTETAENGIELMRRGVPVDLVLMDISLPKLDGYEATRVIKRDKELAKVPVVMLTAHATKEDRDRGFEAGCNDFCTKPIVDEEAFLQLVSRNLKKD